jgi:hypothetical protein
VVVAEEVQDPVREIAIQLGVERPALLARGAARGVEGDDHVAEERAGAGGGERQDVGRAVAPAVLAVQAPDLVLVDERDREVPVRDARLRQRRLRRPADRAVGGAADLDLGGYGRSREACSS